MFFLDEEEPFNEIEKPKFENGIACVVLISHVLLYALLLLPYLMSDNDVNLLAFFSYIGVFCLTEIILLCTYRRKVNCASINFYTFSTTISGFLNRVVLLFIA